MPVGGEEGEEDVETEGLSTLFYVNVLTDDNGDPNDSGTSSLTASSSQSTSLFLMLEYLGYTSIYEQTLNNSLDTYHQELFRKQEQTQCTIYGHRLSDRERETMTENKCFICLEEYQAGDYLTTLLCTHSFHSSCLYEAICHQHNQCPLCRTNLVYETIHEEKVLTVPDHLKRSSHVIYTQHGHRIIFDCGEHDQQEEDA